MDLQLKEKVIVITGAAKGIGKSIAEAFAVEGSIAVIVGRKQADNLLVVEEIENAGGTAYQFEAELSDPESCENVVKSIVAQFGKIDGLVNNAGVNDGVGLEHGNYKDFMSSLHKNVVHYYMMAHFALPELIKSKGAIVNITSKTAETGQGNTSGYAAANGGRNALTREWAVELLKYGIRVNAVVVAECWTPAYETWIATLPDATEKLKDITNQIPFEKRMTTADEIANMVVFLMSSRSSHTTGQIVHVDGGYVHLDRALANV
jgi:L-fucose dehydrogenase